MASAPSHVLCVSSSAEQRLAFAEQFLRALSPRGPALLLVPSSAAATALMARVLGPGEARFGWRRRTLDALARELALPLLARAGRVPIGGLGREALLNRVVHELGAAGTLGRYAPLATRPGFVRALGRTLEELRLGLIAPRELAPHAPELSCVLEAYEGALARLALADRAAMYEAATQALEARVDASVPLLALDVALAHPCEAGLAHALASGRTHVAATVARGDERSEAYFRLALGAGANVVRVEPQGASDLARLQTRLFSVRERADGPAASITHGAVALVSSPGEAREAVEIAREIARAAAEGVPFDRMAVVLRAVEGYRAVLEEALARADIPAHFADGVRRPRGEGRALLSLLACARDGLSASAFAEYLSLGAMPRAEGEEPPASPRRWERMLVEAAVVGGRERWVRRLRGLARSLAEAQQALEPDDPRREALARDGALLAELERFALPILDALAALPEGGTWGAMREALTALAHQTLREPDAVCELLAELAPLAPIGPVSLRDVHRVLEPRLASVVVPSTGHGAGKVFVGAIEDVRGRAFDVVFVPGLAERVFPPRIGEDALLPDAVRRTLGAELWVSEERVARERLLLRLAVGASRTRLVLSFPRFDVAHGRPRVPSFYGLEVLQAIDGALPAFDELTRRAQPGAAARMGFPAPADARQAIDDAEYDLSMLERLRRAPVPARRGAARYLLEASVHLARALRFRARRWELTRFSPADGFVASDDAGKALLASERLRARTYSPSALAHFAICPYRFYLHAIAKIAEQPEVLGADELDARQRGVLFHAVQRALLSELREAGLLPLTRAHADDARARLARVFAEHAAEARDDHAPSIEAVFEAGLGALQRDLGEWLARLVDDTRFVPLYFELGFGLPARRELDAASVEAPVLLAEGVQLAGAIDLVERAAEPDASGVHSLRATDHKTAPAPDKPGTTSGGRSLQPLLYGLALEQVFPEERVSGGRLYFCTARGGYKSHEVALDAHARRTAQTLLASIDALIEQGLLPAAPAMQPEDRSKSECERCTYRVICGPYEAERVGAVKGRDMARLAPLSRVRGLP